MQPKGLWRYYLAMVIVWFAVNQEHEGLRYLEKAPAIVKHIVDYGFLILFAIIGYFGILSYHELWLTRLWKLLYAIAIFIVGIIGLIDYFSYIESINIRLFFGYFRTFFTSPLSFGIFTFLMKMKNRTQKESV